VRSIAARALGIRGDKDSADSLAELATADPQYMVRIRAVEALALLKLKPEAIEAARKDSHLAVQWSANIAIRQLESKGDDAAVLRKAFAAGIKREAMGSAKVGQRAPDFAALTIDGQPYKLSDVLGKKPIAIYFAAFDG
jgi:HEAT repeat protein